MDRTFSGRLLYTDMKKLITIYILILSIPMLFAQTGNSGRIFPTRLSISSTDTTISLSWKNSGKDESGYSIYRYTDVITGENFNKAEKIIQISADIQNFEDFPPARDVPYFYAILALDSMGIEDEIFIPFANVNLYGVSVIFTLTEEEQTVNITRLNAENRNRMAVLSFDAEPNGKELLIYRNTSPIITKEDLLDAILIDRISSTETEYIDTPIYGVEYFYALIGTQAFKKGEITFESGRNSTDTAIILPTNDDSVYSIDADFSLRARPLPYLSTGTVYQNRITSTHMENPTPVVLDELLEFQIKSLITSLPERNAADLVPILLEADKEADSPERDTGLSTILETEFITGDYETALSSLLRYQKLPRTRGIEYRIHFYLGQIYYFTGEFKKALVEFIFAEEVYFIESQTWLKELFKISDLLLES